VVVSLEQPVPNQANGRSNYRIDPHGVIPALGYDPGKYSLARDLWDATRDGDPGFVEIPGDEILIDKDDLNTLIAKLNNGSIQDRWA